MLRYAWLRGKPGQFQKLTGLTVAEFDVLAQKITPLWQEAERKRLSRKNRQRAIGGGKPYKLPSVPDKLLLVLVFLRTYPTYDLLGLLFDLHLSNADRLLRKMLPVLQEATGRMAVRPQRKRPSTLEEFFTLFPDLRDAIVDATEQSIHRPKDAPTQRKHFSGKRKRHTVKTQLLVGQRRGVILDVSDTVPGSVHDKTLLDTSGVLDALPDGATVRGDLGYLGIARSYPELRVILPEKKRRGHARRAVDRRRNRARARQRIVVEHTIRRCKIFRVLGDTYRQSRERYNAIFRVVAGLVNFRLAVAT